MLKKTFFTFLLFSITLFPGCPTKHYSSIYNSDCRNNKLTKYISGMPNISTQTSLCHDYRFSEQKLAEVISIFVVEYSNEFNIPKKEIWEHLSGLKIEMSAIPRVIKFGYSVEGKLLENTPVIGLALSKKRIWVEIKTNLIADSALIHELVHIIIWNQQGVHADPDHEGEEFSGWTEQHSKLISRLRFLLLDLNF